MPEGLRGGPDQVSRHFESEPQSDTASLLSPVVESTYDTVFWTPERVGTTFVSIWEKMIAHERAGLKQLDAEIKRLTAEAEVKREFEKRLQEKQSAEYWETRKKQLSKEDREKHEWKQKLEVIFEMPEMLAETRMGLIGIMGAFAPGQVSRYDDVQNDEDQDDDLPSERR